MKKPKRTTKKLSTKNSKILHDTMVTLGALKESSNLHELPINEVQVYLLDEDGEGIILCLEYDELSGELNKTFHNTPEENEVELQSNTPHYYGSDDLDPCISPENIKTRFEEGVSEEYDEIFHNNNDNEEEPPPLLN